MNLTPEDLGKFAGGFAAAAVATSLLFWKYVAPLLKKRSADVEAIKAELGVGQGPRVAQTIDAMHSTVNRVDSRLFDVERLGRENANGIFEVIQTQKDHGRKIDEHHKRLEGYEERFRKHEERFKPLEASVEEHNDCPVYQETRKKNIGPPTGFADRRKRKNGL